MPRKLQHGRMARWLEGRVPEINLPEPEYVLWRALPAAHFRVTLHDVLSIETTNNKNSPSAADIGTVSTFWGHTIIVPSIILTLGENTP